MKGGARSIGSRIRRAARVVAEAFLPAHHFARSFGDGVAVPDERHDVRTSSAPVPEPAAGGGVVTFAASGARVRADGRTPLLRVAEDAGLAVPHGCRMGICHTCDTTLVSGCVRDLRTGESVAEPGTRICVCVCAAAGDVELAL